MKLPARSPWVVCGGALAAALVAASLLPSAPPSVHAASRSDREAGRALFNEKGCSHCHGADGVGGERGPALLGVGRKLHADQIRQQIVAGGGGMPAFGEVLQPDEVSRLVDWLKTQRSRVVPVPPKPAAPKLPSPDAAGSDDQK